MNQYTFFKSLKVGDVITTDGVCNEEIVSNQSQHDGAWNRYARITEVGSPLKQDEKNGTAKAFGVKWEGIDQSIQDCFTHIGVDKEVSSKFMMRKASRSERRTFLKEYLKTRVAIVEHRRSEMSEQKKALTAQMKNLNKIASEEKIDVSKLLKKKK